MDMRSFRAGHIVDRIGGISDLQEVQGFGMSYKDGIGYHLLRALISRQTKHQSPGRYAEVYRSIF
jgi:hypothetical protein